MNALEKAIAAAGGASRLAAKIGLSPMAISHWKNRHRGIVPSSHVLPVFETTGVIPHELRPDLYPNPTDGIPKKKE